MHLEFLTFLVASIRPRKILFPLHLSILKMGSIFHFIHIRATINLSLVQLYSLSYYLLTCTFILYAEHLAAPTCQELFLYLVHENAIAGCNGFHYVQAMKSSFHLLPCKTQRWANHFFYVSNRDGFISSFQSPSIVSIPFFTILYCANLHILFSFFSSFQ